MRYCFRLKGLVQDFKCVKGLVPQVRMGVNLELLKKCLKIDKVGITPTSPGLISTLESSLFTLKLSAVSNMPRHMKTHMV